MVARILIAWAWTYRLETRREAFARGPDKRILIHAKQKFGDGTWRYDFNGTGQTYQITFPGAHLNLTHCKYVIQDTLHRISSWHYPGYYQYGRWFKFKWDGMEPKKAGSGDILRIIQPDPAPFNHVVIIDGNVNDNMAITSFRDAVWDPKTKWWQQGKEPHDVTAWTGKSWGAQGPTYLSGLSYDIGPLDWNLPKWHNGEHVVPDPRFPTKPYKRVTWKYEIFRPQRKLREGLAVWAEIGLLGFFRDPLLADLNGGGIETVGVDAGVHVDHNCDGFKELTGWGAPGEGMLVFDMNGNGRLDDGSELIGDSTVLPDGRRARNGFEVLAYYDDNEDGKIDADDEVWSELGVWQWREDYATTPAYSYDPQTCGWICSLDELGITAIYVDSEDTNTTDSAGNTEMRAGSFQWADGTRSTIAEYSFEVDMCDTIAPEELEVPEEIQALPDFNTRGTVYSLQQAMVRDSEGGLKALVEEFASEEDIGTREAICEQILFKLTGADEFEPDSRGPFMDGRRVFLLESFFGESWPNPDAVRAADLEGKYQEIFEGYYSALVRHTHLKDLFDSMYTWDDEIQDYALDPTDAISTVIEVLENDPEEGKKLVSELGRSLRGMNFLDHDGYLFIREHFIQQDPELAWVFDSGGLPVYDEVGEGRPGSPNIEGTDNADAIKGSLTEGTGWLKGYDGNDVIYGTDRDEVLSQDSGDGNGIFVGGGGNDTIKAWFGDDILDGGEGNDELFGEAGNDTYIFRIGCGVDTIIDRDATEGNIDTIWVGSNLKPDDVVLIRSGSDLVLQIVDTLDTLTVQDYYKNCSPLNQIERIQFMDGTVWAGDDVSGNVSLDTMQGVWLYGTKAPNKLVGGMGNDMLYGFEGNDTLLGLDGNDGLLGGMGDDILEGGLGTDVLHGYSGSDTYIFYPGDGEDRIIDNDRDAEGIDTLVLYFIDPADVEVERISGLMDVHQGLGSFRTHVYQGYKLTISGTDDSISVLDWIGEENAPYHGVEAIRFDDYGTVWGNTEIMDMLVTGTEEDDSLRGFSRSDTMCGFGGNDHLYSHEGNDIVDGGPGDDLVMTWTGDDIVDGGPGNDILQGEADNDTLRGGEGEDTLEGGSGNDILDGEAGNDFLFGGMKTRWYWYVDDCNGDDTYLFGRGSGQDIIIDHDKSPGNMDTIRMGDDITPDDISVVRDGGDLVLSIAGTSDTLTVLYWFSYHSQEFEIERIEFADGTVWDSGTINRMMVLQGTPGIDYLIGYAGSDTIEGYGANDKLYGHGGDDTIDGGAGADRLYGQDGNDTLRGDEGDDTLWGGFGNDILAGGSGNDILQGGDERSWYAITGSNGNDTYLFGIGSGQDTIIDYDGTAGNIDTIQLLESITWDDVIVRREGDDLTLSLNGTDDRLTVSNWFLDDSTEYRVEHIRLDDGTIWDEDTIKLMVIQGTSSKDVLIGYATDDTISGLASDDHLYGKNGNDILDGGAGNDNLVGGYEDEYWNRPDASNGNDVYLFGRGSGQDHISDRDATAGNVDAVLLDSDIMPGDVRAQRIEDDLLISITGTTDTLTVHRWFKDESNEWQVEEIRFADGTTWDVDTIKLIVLQGTAEDDLLIGYSGPDTIDGLAGDDRIFGRGGEDILNGGTGNDSLDGGKGNDTYLLEPGSGHDVIVDYDTTPGNVDSVQLGAGVQQFQIALKRGGDDLFISLETTGDTLQICDWFADDGHKIERLQFSDGAVWDSTYMQQISSIPTDTDDYLVGTPGNDVIDGGGGRDMIEGLEGNDILLGGAEDDELWGGPGADRLEGGTGGDRLDGGSGTNILEGGPGDDTIVADQGHNTIFVEHDGFDTIISHMNELGTPVGTIMVKDIYPGQGWSMPMSLIDVDGTLFFTAYDDQYGRELRKSDGTEAGTVMVKDINPGSESGPSDSDTMAHVNGTVFFAGYDGENGRELWVSDGTDAGTVMVKDINPGSESSWVSELTNANGILFFRANDGTSGEVLWRSDGTDSGTVMVADIRPNSTDDVIYDLTNVDGTLFFVASDEVHGSELWKSDGTGAGTVMVKDIRAGSDDSGISNLINVNGTLFFTASDGARGTELWLIFYSWHGLARGLTY